MHHLLEYLPWSTLIKISPQGVVSILVRGFQILFNHAPLAYNNASAVLHPGSWLQCTQADVRVHVPGMWSLLSRLLRLVTFCSSWWWSGDGLVVEKNMGPQHLVDGSSSVWYSTSEAQIQPAARDLGCGAVTRAKMPQIGGGVEMLRSWCYRAAKLPDRSRNDGFSSCCSERTAQTCDLIVEECNTPIGTDWWRGIMGGDQNADLQVLQGKSITDRMDKHNQIGS